MELVAVSARRKREHRFYLLRAALAALVLLCASLGLAEGTMVPIELQAELLAKISSYDRNFGARSPARVPILLVAHPGDPTSVPAVLEMQRALAGLASVGGRLHDERVVIFSTLPALLDVFQQNQPAIVYFGPGFRDQIESISAAFDGQSVLTVSAVPGDVARGIVLGFELVSSKPKLLVHLSQARKQNVDFRAEVLKLVQIYQ